MTKLRHWDGLGSARFVTFSCFRRQPYLNQLGAKGLLIDEFEHARTKGVKRVFWQRRCYDHNCRTVESVREKVRYCHQNPVTRGLVESPSEWEWSSYNWYRGQRNVPLAIDDDVFS